MRPASFVGPDQAQKNSQNRLTGRQAVGEISGRRTEGGKGMKRLATAAALAVLMTVTFAGTAWARGDGWEPVDNQPFSFDACGVTTNWTFPVDREYSSATVDEQGIVHIKLTGA